MTSRRQQRDGRRGHRARAVTTPRKVATPIVVRPTTATKPVVRPPVITRSVPVKTPAITPIVTPVRPPPVTPTLPAPIPPIVPTSPLPLTPSSALGLSTSSALPLPITLASTSSPIPTTTPTSILSTSADIPVLPLSTTSAEGSLASSAPINTTTASKGTNAGAIIGGVVGGLVAVAAISAAIAMFLRRMREKKRDHAEAFDASKFRSSAILLEDSAESRGKPRPPTMIERHVQNTPQSNPPPLPRPVDEQLRHGIPYASSSQPYGNPYPSYGIQGPYPPRQPTYGMLPHQDIYGVMHQGYPPQPVYHPPQPHYHPQQYTYNHPIPPPPSTLQPSGRDLVLPNPFSSSTTRDSAGESPVPSHHEVSAAQPSSSAQDVDAPPAYEDKERYVNFKPDVKVKPSNALRATNDDAGPGLTATLAHSQSPRADDLVNGHQDSP